MSTQFRDLRIGDKFKFIGDSEVWVKIDTRMYDDPDKLKTLVPNAVRIGSTKSFVERVK